MNDSKSQGARSAQVLYITLAVSAASYAFVYSALVALAPGLALLRARPWAHVQTIASMAATLAIARSPASMVSLALQQIRHALWHSSPTLLRPSLWGLSLCTCTNSHVTY